MSIIVSSEVLVEKQEKKLSQCLKYIINNVYGLIATQKVAEYVFREGSFYTPCRKKNAYLCFKVLFLFPYCSLSVKCY